MLRGAERLKIQDSYKIVARFLDWTEKEIMRSRLTIFIWGVMILPICQTAFARRTLSWSPLALSSTEETEAIQNHLALETDESSNLLIYRGYVVKFDESKKTPIWTMHHLTFDQIDKTKPEGLNRQNYTINFKQDPNQLELSDHAHHNDYTNSGYDRGHMMTPATDFYTDSLNYLETFCTTNITPQTQDYNQTVMLEMEKVIRNWVRTHKNDCYVITGGLYQSKNTARRGVSKKHVQIPSAFYKVIYGKLNGDHKLYCFLVPHMFAYPNFKLTDYQVKLDEIEKLTGEDFLDYCHRSRMLPKSAE